ncbi:XRE family transcriptional regulator [Aquimarina agarilytica]|uniref:XRE family transcriptional regulator n=1 Tax=Aquimarina agarilytica TaxID=1087449 RepID=UPI0002882684|nr:LexA family transcriptional regulator [Aquimarina agarilytica]
MENSNTLAAKRFKQIRESEGATQKEFATQLGIKNNIADIERGRTKITGYTLVKLIQHCNINPLWLYGFSAIKNANTIQKDTSPKLITLNSEKNENMILVDAKAAAGYPTNIQDRHWFTELPAFDFPLPQYRNATFRGFQVQGDSMYPHLKPNEWVIAKATDSINNLSNQRICVVVLKDSVLVKELHKQTDHTSIKLISLNPSYPEINIDINDIQEVWEVTSKLSFDIHSIGETATIHELQLAMQRLTNEVNNLKNN